MNKPPLRNTTFGGPSACHPAAAAAAAATWDHLILAGEVFGVWIQCVSLSHHPCKSQDGVIRPSCPSGKIREPPCAWLGAGGGRRKSPKTAAHLAPSTPCQILSPLTGCAYSPHTLCMTQLRTLAQSLPSVSCPSSSPPSTHSLSLAKPLSAGPPLASPCFWLKLHILAPSAGLPHCPASRFPSSVVA